MPDYITSERQFSLYQFLERVGPCPLPALELVFGQKTLKALKGLRQAGYIYNITLSSTEFWACQDYGRFNPLKQLVISWFAARLEEAGGQYLGSSGISPKGVVFALSADRSCMHIIDQANHKFIARLNHLQTECLSDCLEWERQ